MKVWAYLLQFLDFYFIFFAGTCESDIFTIINDNVLQRKIQSSSKVDIAENSNNASSSNNRIPTSDFFLLSIEELIELKKLKNEQIVNDHLPLPSIYIHLQENRPTMFHSVKYSNFFNFENSSEITETVKIGSNPKNFNVSTI